MGCGQLKPCPTSDIAKLAHVLAHELGHRLGLSDSDCLDNIMSRIPSGPDNTNVQPGECAAADSLNHTAAERGVCDQPNDCRVSPILLSCQQDTWNLTSVARGVSFDYDGDGDMAQTAWTPRQSALGLLFTDLDGTGCAEQGPELFGENRLIGEGSIAANGFEALDGYDSNRDGRITHSDADWNQLRLWVDSSHDGLCTLDEVTSLDEARVLSISLAYSTSERIDRHGNAFRFYSDVLCSEDSNPPVRRTFWDIFFATNGSD